MVRMKRRNKSGFKCNLKGGAFPSIIVMEKLGGGEALSYITL